MAYQLRPLPYISRGAYLAEFIAVVQAECDDASSDHLFVLPDPVLGQPAPPTINQSGLVTSPYVDDNVTMRAASNMALAVVQMVSLHRANGGRGRGVVSFRWGEKGLEAGWRFITSPTAMWNFAGETPDGQTQQQTA